MAPSLAITAQQLEDRRKQLRMSQEALAARSGVSLSTVNRMIAKGVEHATLANVQAVATALGMTVQMGPTCSPREFQEQAARKKAERIVGLVQGTSALEAQAVDQPTLHDMVQRTFYELMAGSPSRLWAT